MNEAREKLIRRIVEEKGKDAIPTLIRLLYDDDPDVKEIAADALYRLGDDAKNALYEELKRRWREGVEEDDITVLYMVDLLGDFGDRRAKEIFYSLLSKYTIEEAVLIIYEALAKIGEGEELLGVLEYMLLEDGDRNRFGDQVAMVLAYIDSRRSVEILVKAFEDEELDMEVKDFVLQSLRILLDRNPSFVRFVPEDILKEMRRIEWN